MGFSVSRHFCGGTLVDVSVIAGVADSCSDDGSSCEMGNCCHNENQVYQLDEDYTSPMVLDHVAYLPVQLATIYLQLLHEQLDVELASATPLVPEPPPPPNVLAVLSDIQVYRL